MKKIVLILLIIVAINLFQITVAAEQNFVKNPSFENAAANIPDEWTVDTWNKEPDASQVTVENSGAHTGNKFVTIQNKKENDTRLTQKIKVKKNTNYKLSCWIRTEGVSENGKGANLSISGRLETSKQIHGTIGNWERVEMYAKVGKGIDDIVLTLGLGGYSGVSTGKASFDDVVVEEVKSIPSGAVVSVIEKTSESSSQDKQNSKAGQSDTKTIMWVVFIISAIVIAGALVVAKRNEKSMKESDSNSEDKYSEDFEDEV